MINSHFTHQLSILLSIFICFAPAQAETPGPSATDTLRILTYNIGRPDDSSFGRFGSFIRGEASATARSEAILALLREQDADVIALQEVTPVFLSALEEQKWRPQYHLEHTLSDSQLSEAPYFLQDPDGMAILSKSRCPVTAVYNRSLHSGYLARRMLMITLPMNGDSLRLATCHLESGRGYGEIRAQQLETFFEKLAPHDNAVLLGDFNFRDGQQPETSALHQEFRDPGLELIKNGPISTFHGLPGRRFDRILLRSKDWETVDIQLFGKEPVMIDGEKHLASDHYGVVATLRRTGSRAARRFK